MMQLILTYDMRAPAFGAPRVTLYQAALEQARWADDIGLDMIAIGEHHATEDGYNPSTLILASAFAARTQKIKIRTSILIAPLYDMVKLAEDAAVTQIISGGRLELGIGAGYRPAEFEMFGRDLKDRWHVMADTCAFLRLAWKGEAFEWQGRKCLVTPKPEPFAPPIVLAGESVAGARRAAHIADLWYPPGNAALWPPYREECIALGKPDPGDYPKQGPVFLWVTKTPERDWDWLLPHVVYQANSYAQWYAEATGKNTPTSAFTSALSPEAIRKSDSYKVVTPEECLRLFEELGDNSVVYINPLLAGIAPEKSWEMLRLYEKEVHSHLKR